MFNSLLGKCKVRNMNCYYIIYSINHCKLLSWSQVHLPVSRAWNSSFKELHSFVSSLTSFSHCLNSTSARSQPLKNIFLIALLTEANIKRLYIILSEPPAVSCKRNPKKPSLCRPIGIIFLRACEGKGGRWVFFFLKNSSRIFLKIF